MKKYNQLSLAQRYQIQALLSESKSFSDIAKFLGVHKSTISREMQRNIPKVGKHASVYNPELAWEKTQNRHRHKAKRTLFTLQMKETIVNWMKFKRWSPELISVMAKQMNMDMVSHETIYQWIWEMKKSNRRENKPYKLAYKLLKHACRRKKRGRIRDSRGVLPDRVTIDRRPAIVKKRIRPGDYEVDLMLGKNQKSVMLIITDRATIRTKIRKVKSKNSAHIAEKIIDALGQEEMPVRTITFDNDKAFAKHKLIGERLSAETYFTRPYSSQEKGTVENRIGVIRMFFPRKTDFTLVSHHQVRAVEREINNRPVRKFNYRTPNQEYELKSKSCT